MRLIIILLRIIAGKRNKMQDVAGSALYLPTARDYRDGVRSRFS